MNGRGGMSEWWVDGWKMVRMRKRPEIKGRGSCRRVCLGVLLGDGFIAHGSKPQPQPSQRLISLCSSLTQSCISLPPPLSPLTCSLMPSCHHMHLVAPCSCDPVLCSWRILVAPELEVPRLEAPHLSPPYWRSPRRLVCYLARSASARAAAALISSSGTSGLWPLKHHTHHSAGAVHTVR